MVASQPSRSERVLRDKSEFSRRSSGENPWRRLRITATIALHLAVCGYGNVAEKFFIEALGGV